MKSSVTLLGTGLLAAGFLLLSGCGGGGGGSTATELKATTVITADNADAVTAGAVGSVTAGDSQLNGSTLQLYSLAAGGFAGASAPDLTVGILTLVPPRSGLSTRSLETRDTATEACQDGGSVTVTTSPDGKSGDILYDHCSEGGYTMNGRISFDLSDPTRETVTLTDLSLLSADVDSEFTSAVIDAFYDSNDTLAAVDATMTATVTFKTDTYAMKGTYRYNAFHMHVDDIAAPPLKIRVSGLVSAPCTGGWVDVETVETIVTDYDACPTAGKLEALGAENTKAEALFNADGSVDVVFDGQSRHYDSCEDLSAACASGSATAG
jgi:hypothetical protein